MKKARLRSQMLSYLHDMGPEVRALKSRAACNNLIATPEFQKATVIMVYLSLDNEMDTTDAVLAAWQQGKTVVAPKVLWKERFMIPVMINSLEKGFSTETGGLRNPLKGTPVPFEEIDLVIVPGLGFDKNGNRLGRGCAYYDRFFAEKSLKARRCGFAFDGQLVDEVPVTPSDQPMDLLVTDEQVLYFENRKGD